MHVGLVHWMGLITTWTKKALLPTWSEHQANLASAKIVDIQIAGAAARATLEVEGFWGTISFTDFFQLAKFDGRWQITCKTFAQTGGTHA